MQYLQDYTEGCHSLYMTSDLLGHFLARSCYLSKAGQFGGLRKPPVYNLVTFLKNKVYMVKPFCFIFLFIRWENSSCMSTCQYMIVIFISPQRTAEEQMLPR